MRWIIIPLLVSLQGCAVYTVASATSFLATNKTITDHAASTITQADCSTTNPLQAKYYCEIPRTPGTHYNRNPI